MKTGIFFGGPSREREVSFRSGCSVFHSIDRSLFEPFPVFIDSFGNFILLDEKHMSAGTVREFYPPPALYPSADSRFEAQAEAMAGSEQAERMIAEVGRKITPDQFPALFEMAVIALHGPYGEDGNLQGILEWYNIPYTGSGIFGSALGIDKILQNRLLRQVTGQKKADAVLSFTDWNRRDRAEIFAELCREVNLPMVIKAPHQGSSVGIRILKNNNLEEFITKVNDCFFINYLSKKDWADSSEGERLARFKNLISVENGVGMPMVFETKNQVEEIAQPEALWNKLNAHFAVSEETVKLSSSEHEEELLIEEFINGREFTCAVLQDETGRAIALAPTEVIKDNEQEFDFQAKYTPGLVVEQILMDAPEKDLERIREACEHVFKEMSLNVYVRIDGFLTESGDIFLHDPNTVPGMTPQSFIFRQMAEMGFSPGATITFLIRASLGERMKTGKKTRYLRELIRKTDEKIEEGLLAKSKLKRQAIIFGGFPATEKSLESAKKIYNRISAEAKYQACPVLVCGTPEAPEFYEVPVRILFKDSIAESIAAVKNNRHPFIEKIAETALEIREKYTGKYLNDAKRININEIKNLVSLAYVTTNESTLIDELLVKMQIEQTVSA